MGHFAHPTFQGEQEVCIFCFPGRVRGLHCLFSRGSRRLGEKLEEEKKKKGERDLVIYLNPDQRNTDIPIIKKEENMKKKEEKKGRKRVQNGRGHEEWSNGGTIATKLRSPHHLHNNSSNYVCFIDFDRLLVRRDGCRNCLSFICTSPLFSFPPFSLSFLCLFLIFLHLLLPVLIFVFSFSSLLYSLY